MEKIWLKSYPKGIPAEIDVNEYQSVRELFEESVGKYAARPAFTCMGKSMTFGELDTLLGGQPYLMGEAFTVADAYAFAILSWSRLLRVDLAPFPSLRAYLDRVEHRPAVRAALTAEGRVKKAA